MVYGATPPLGVTLIYPSLLPLQVTFVATQVAVQFWAVILKQERAIQRIDHNFSRIIF